LENLVFKKKISSSERLKKRYIHGRTRLHRYNLPSAAP